MLTKNKTFIIYLLSFFFLISLSDWAIAQKLTEEEVATLTKEEKIAKLNHFNKEQDKLNTEILNVRQKIRKLADHYVEFTTKEIKRDGKTYNEQVETFVKKDDIRKKAEKMMENLDFAGADAMIKEYEKRNEYLSKLWDKRWDDLDGDLLPIEYNIWLLNIYLSEEEEQIGSPSAITKTVSATNATGLDIWFDTGIDIQQGSTLKIQANGKWRLGLGPRKCDANGLSNFPNYNGHLYGTLLGKIGKEGAVFKIGTEYNGQANAEGKLYLGNNDSNDEDNSESITVKIEIK